MENFEESKIPNQPEEEGTGEEKKQDDRITFDINAHLGEKKRKQKEKTKEQTMMKEG